MDYNEELDKAVNGHLETTTEGCTPAEVMHRVEGFRAGAKWQDEYVRAHLIKIAPFCMIPPEIAGDRPTMVHNMPPDLMNKILDWAAEEAIKGMREVENPQE